MVVLSETNQTWLGQSPNEIEFFFWENHRTMAGLVDCPAMAMITGGYPLVICYIAIENGHRNRGFTH